MKKRYIPSILIVLCLLIAACVGVAYAKYASVKKAENLFLLSSKVSFGYAVLDDEDTLHLYAGITEVPEVGGYLPALEGATMVERTVTGIYQIPNIDQEMYASPSTATESFYTVKDRVTSVAIETEIKLKNLERFFEDFNKCISIKGLEKIDTSSVISTYAMFRNCSALTELDFGDFDTAEVTTMQNMFSSCSALQELDLSSFDTAKVTTMRNMFSSCSALTKLNVSSFDTAKVTTMQYMFSYCSKLTTLDVSKFNTANVTDMQYMFSYCSKLTTLDLSSFNTVNVTDMQNMFYECSKLTTLDVSSFDTAKVTTMRSMFSSCSKLTTLDVSSFDTANVTDMQYMFSYCSALKKLEVSNFDTKNVEHMQNMFSYCSALTKLDLSSFNTGSVTNMEKMFYHCDALTTLDLSSFYTAKVGKMNYMFQYDPSLTTIYASENFVTTQISYSVDVFAGCTSLTGGLGTTLAKIKASGVSLNDACRATYARIDGGSEHPGYFTYYKYALVFEANGGLGAPDVLLSDDGTFTIPAVTGIVSSEGYPLLGWATTKNAADAEYKSGTTYTINDTAPCCKVLYAVYDDKPVIVTNASELDAVMASGKDLIIEGGTYTYMEGFAAGINITLNNIQCKNYFVASSNSNVVINGLDGTKSTTSPLLETGSGSTVTINDAITGNLGGVVNIGRNATLIINAGTYNRPMLVKEGNPNSNLIINGGTFTNVTSVSDLVGSVGNVTIKGGTFGFDPTDSGYVAEGYTVVDNGNGTWTVILDANAASTQSNDPPAN